jgi:hypothetical protein
MKDLGGRLPLYFRKERTTAIFQEGEDNREGLRGWSSGQRSQLGSGGTLKKNLHQISGLKIAKQMVEAPIRMRKMTDWTLWRDRPPPKQKKRLHTEQELEM